MSGLVESQLLGDWSYEISMEDLAKVGGGYPPPWEVDPTHWGRGLDIYGKVIHIYYPYGAPVFNSYG